MRTFREEKSSCNFISHFMPETKKHNAFLLSSHVHHLNYSFSKPPLNLFTNPSLTFFSLCSGFVFLHQFFIDAVKHTVIVSVKESCKGPTHVCVNIYTCIYKQHAKSYSSRSELRFEFVNMQVNNTSALTFTHVIILRFFIQRFMQSLV